MGVSEQEAIDCSEIIETTDEFASFDEKGRIVWDMDRLDQIPIYKKRVDYWLNEVVFLCTILGFMGLYIHTNTPKFELNYLFSLSEAC